MKKYFVLYMAPSAEFAKLMSTMKPEDSKKSMDEWREWMKKNKESLVDNGAPLGKTKRVDSGGVSDVKNDIGGYSIVQASSHEEAVKLFEGHGHLRIPGATIEVMEIVSMPEM